MKSGDIVYVSEDIEKLAGVCHKLIIYGLEKDRVWKYQCDIKDGNSIIMSHENWDLVTCFECLALRYTQ